jgi:hypothetical protein
MTPITSFVGLAMVVDMTSVFIIWHVFLQWEVGLLATSTIALIIALPLDAVSKTLYFKLNGPFF